MYPHSAFRFSFWGNIRQNHPFGNHPLDSGRRRAGLPAYAITPKRRHPEHLDMDNLDYTHTQEKKIPQTWYRYPHWSVTSGVSKRCFELCGEIRFTCPPLATLILASVYFSLLHLDNFWPSLHLVLPLAWSQVPNHHVEATI